MIKRSISFEKAKIATIFMFFLINHKRFISTCFQIILYIVGALYTPQSGKGCVYVRACVNNHKHYIYTSIGVSHTLFVKRRQTYWFNARIWNCCMPSLLFLNPSTQRRSAYPSPREGYIVSTNDLSIHPPPPAIINPSPGLYRDGGNKFKQGRILLNYCQEIDNAVINCACKAQKLRVFITIQFKVLGAIFILITMLRSVLRRSQELFA